MGEATGQLLFVLNHGLQPHGHMAEGPASPVLPAAILLLTHLGPGPHTVAYGTSVLRATLRFFQGLVRADSSVPSLLTPPSIANCDSGASVPQDRKMPFTLCFLYFNMFQIVFSIYQFL